MDEAGWNVRPTVKEVRDDNGLACSRSRGAGEK